MRADRLAETLLEDPQVAAGRTGLHLGHHPEQEPAEAGRGQCGDGAEQRRGGGDGHPTQSKGDGEGRETDQPPEQPECDPGRGEYGQSSKESSWP